MNAGNWAIFSSEGPRSVLERGLRSLSPYCHHVAAANAVIQTDAAIQSSGLKERAFVAPRTAKLGSSIGATCAVSPLAGDHATEHAQRDARAIVPGMGGVGRRGRRGRRKEHRNHGQSSAICASGIVDYLRPTCS